MTMIIKDVSPAELEVMEIIWNAGKPVIITDIWQAVQGHDWTYQTVQTFVNRLHMKGFIEVVSKRVRSFEYLPLLTRAEYVAECRGQLFDGTKGASIADFIRAMKKMGKCSAEDIAEIEKAIAEMK